MNSNPITLAIAGGTGKAGQVLVREALRRGFTLRVLARNAQALADIPKEMVLQGDALDPSAVQELVHGADALISVLGGRPGEPPPVHRFVESALEAMASKGPRRFLMVAGITVDMPGDTKPVELIAQQEFLRQHYPDALADKQAAADVLARSALDWTLVRIPRLDPNGPESIPRAGLVAPPASEVSALTLATFLLKEVTANRYLRQAPCIG